jgi:hypothetical protein
MLPIGQSYALLGKSVKIVSSGESELRDQALFLYAAAASSFATETTRHAALFPQKVAGDSRRYP